MGSDSEEGRGLQKSPVFSGDLSWKDLSWGPVAMRRNTGVSALCPQSLGTSADGLHLDHTPSPFSNTTELSSKCYSRHLYFHRLRGYV